MAVIAHDKVEIRPGDPWPAIVEACRRWFEAEGVESRDAIVLLPFVQHLACARRAWARVLGWMPRIETTQSLARSLGPSSSDASLPITFDAALDRLSARQLLANQGALAAWSRRDPLAFDQAVASVTQTAQSLVYAVATVLPEDRASHWTRCRALLSAGNGPGATEMLLARVALEWAAAASETLPTDALFRLKPSAWIAVRAGGADPWVSTLMARALPCTPCLLLDTDVSADEPFMALAGHADAQLAVCDAFEAEAQFAASQVLVHLNAGNTPVALIAQDRVLVRRVRALLSRQQVPLLDETGWKLSTTRAGASVTGLLRATRANASTDEWLDWLKSCAQAWPGVPRGALASLEGTLRRKGWSTVRAVDTAQLPEPAAVLWRAAVDVLAELAQPREQTMARWLPALRSALQRSGNWNTLDSDAAGRQLIAALHLQSGIESPSGSMSIAEFAGWVEDALEDATFLPEPPAEALVVITPLERAMLRPFGAVVMPGCDEKRLGAAASPHPLLSDATAAELGLPTAASRRDAEALAFAQIVRMRHVTLLRRRDDDGEALSASPLLERLVLAARRLGRHGLVSAADPMTVVDLPVEPVPRPRPSAPSLLPQRLSASACEALRACPYRFFALRVLGLHEAEELDDTVEKRDYGSWLHEVLRRFHTHRDSPRDAAFDEAQLQEIAAEVQHEMQLDHAAFLPFEATFARLVPRYVAWLHERDGAGHRWLDGEREFSARPVEWGGIEMHGVIDRIDSVHTAHGPLTQLIDYKTGSAQNLRNLVRQATEDTQLAFYAALLAQQSDAVGDLSAIYLPLDESDGVKLIEHKHVEVSAQHLVEGVGRDLARIRNGAAMPALGEGRVCDFCEVRGLCRRDHWADP